MDPSPRDPQLTDLINREAIRDCIYRYCRGIDRADEAALRSSYWPDAHDSHGAYNGPVEGFFTWVKSVWTTNPRNVHQVSNILIEFRGAQTAAVETYFNALQRGRGADGIEKQFMLAGRYCDVFEQRGGEWRVASRTVVYDWVDEQSPAAGDEAIRFGARQPIGASFPGDPVYQLGKSQAK
jgi:hypothetical protein